MSRSMRRLSRLCSTSPATSNWLIGGEAMEVSRRRASARMPRDDMVSGNSPSRRVTIRRSEPCHISTPKPPAPGSRVPMESGAISSSRLTSIALLDPTEIAAGASITVPRTPPLGAGMLVGPSVAGGTRRRGCCGLS
jgi:hypothetical protein